MAIRNLFLIFKYNKKMSLFVDQIVKDLKENPNTFTRYGRNGVQKENLIITGYGNTKMFSLIDVIIKTKNIPLTYCDRWKLEGAVKNWYKSIPLEHILK